LLEPEVWGHVCARTPPNTFGCEIYAFPSGDALDHDVCGGTDDCTPYFCLGTDPLRTQSASTVKPLES
jgi:hypothetical protein